MSEQFFSLVRSCSNTSKVNLSNFLSQLLRPQAFVHSNEVEFKLQKLFKNLTNYLTLSKIRQISKIERSKKDLTNHQYNYGQITFGTVFRIIKTIQKYHALTDKQIFYDLGSGSGKVLFAAGICFSFYKCKGIEFLETLYSKSKELIDKIHENATHIEEQVSQASEIDYKLPPFEIYNQDFKKHDWSDGTVIFVSSTCYSRQVMLTISQLCEKLKIGTILITLTRQIQTNNTTWKLLQRFEGQTSWGASCVYIHEKQA